MPEQLKTLTTFYKEHYSKTIIDGENLYYDKLSYILAYEAIDMITNSNNNIQEHFIDHLHKYVNIVFDVKKQRDEITKANKDKKLRKQLHKALYEDINKVKKDLVSFDTLTSNEKYHKWIIEQRIKLFPNKNKFEENNIYYELSHYFNSTTRNFEVYLGTNYNANNIDWTLFIPGSFKTSNSEKKIIMDDTILIAGKLKFLIPEDIYMMYFNKVSKINPLFLSVSK
jgi:hypothetical protein